MLTRPQQSAFRPLVDQAWRAHCRVAHLDPSDRQARDAWYRDELTSAAGIRSTIDAGPREYRLLIRRFTALSEEGEHVTIANFSDPQNACLAQVIAKAWRSAVASGCALAFDAWLDAELSQAGVVNRTAADHVEAFDRVMAHMAILAGDEYWMDRTSAAAEIRLRYLIRCLLDRIGQSTDRVLGWDYAVGIWQQAKLLPDDINDAPAELLWKVLQMLDTHARRLGC